MKDFTYRIERNNDKVNWQELADLLEMSNLAAYDASMRERAFRGSDVVVYLFDDEADGKLIGCGRALSDGAYEAALYDCAVEPAYRGQGLGRFIVEDIINTCEGLNIIFFSSLGQQPFYEKLGCHHMKTGMAYWRNPQRMLDRGYS